MMKTGNGGSITNHKEAEVETVDLFAASEEIGKSCMKHYHENIISINMEKTGKRFLKFCREKNIPMEWFSDSGGSHVYDRKGTEGELLIDRIMMLSILLKIPVDDIVVFREPEE